MLRLYSADELDRLREWDRMQEQFWQGRPQQNLSPDMVPGLALWLDAASSDLFQNSNGTTAAAADGDVVGYWADKSGNSRNATQATTAAKPTFKTGIFGTRPALLFTADDFLGVPRIAALDGCVVTAFYVVKMSGSLTDAMVIMRSNHYPGSGSTNFRNLWGIFSASSLFSFQARNAAGTSKGAEVANSSAATVLTGRWQTSNDVQGRKDGAGFSTNILDDSADAQANHVSSRIGCGYDFSTEAASQFLTGYIAEIAVYSSDLTDAQCASVERYLGSKWGVTVA